MAGLSEQSIRDSLQRYIDGDRDAFVEFYHATRQACYFYIRAQLGAGGRDAADEVLQNFYLKIVRHPGPFLDARNLAAYVYATLRRDVAEHGMAERRMDHASLQDVPDLALADRPPRPSREEDFLGWLRQLPAVQREVITLKLNGDVTLQEVSRLTGQPLQTVAAQYRRGLEAVREHWRRWNQGEK